MTHITDEGYQGARLQDVSNETEPVRGRKKGEEDA